MGLLDYVQDDPTKQEALRQGLLNAGIAMMAGGPQQLGMSIGQGMGAGLPAYQQQLKQLQQRQAQQSAIDAAMGKRPPVPMGAQPGIGPRINTGMNTGSTGMNTGAQLLSADYYGKPAPMGWPMQAHQPMQAPQAMPEQPQQFDIGRYMSEALANPDNPDRDAALQYQTALASKSNAAAKPVLVKRWNPETQQNEQGWMTPGGTDFVSVGLDNPDNVDDGFSQDMSDYLRTHGINPQNASQDQLTAAYDYVQELKTKRAQLAGQTVTLGTPQIFKTDDGQTVLVQPANRPGASPQITRLDKGLKQSADEKPPSEGERKAATLLSRMRFSVQQLNDAVAQNPGAAKPGIVQTGLRKIGQDTAANAANSPERQRIEAAQLDILDAALTLGTGAAYTREQLEGYRSSYFPQLGDDDATVKDKAARLQNVIEAAEIAAGRAQPTELPTKAQRGIKRATPAAAPTGTAQSPYKVTNDAEYNNVPKGKYYQAPDGSIRQRK